MFKSTDVFLTLGRRGSGKSYLARKISEAYPRRIIFDSLSEFSDHDGTVCGSFSEFSKKILETENDSQFTIIYQFDVERENHNEEFEEALRVLWYRGNVLIYVEEIQTFASTHSLGKWVRNCIFTGRHRNIAMIFTTQRPGECNKSLLSQSSHIFCGSLHERNDIEYVRSILDDHAYSLTNIPERQFLYFRPGNPIGKVDNDLKSIVLLNNAVDKDERPLDASNENNLIPPSQGDDDHG